jgi:hypothetical protein
MRAELLEPTKRMEAVARCTKFYIAVPSGMLTDDELAFSEPDWSLDDFARTRCPGMPRVTYDDGRRERNRCGGPCRNPRHGRNGRYSARAARYVSSRTPKGSLVRLPIPAVLRPSSYRTFDGVVVHSDWDIEQAIRTQGFEDVVCPMCDGRGHAGVSRVESEAPTLWVPKDVGLIEVYPSGALVVRREAPKNKTPKTILGDAHQGDDRDRSRRQRVADIVRWTSYRPDPRHAERR